MINNYLRFFLSMNAIGYVACGNEKEAHRIAKHLLKKRLIACANIVPRIHSFYWWKKNIVENKEALLLLKTLKKNEQKIIGEIKKVHSYSVPCIEFIEAKKTSRECERWVGGEIK